MRKLVVLALMGVGGLAGAAATIGVLMYIGTREEKPPTP